MLTIAMFVAGLALLVLGAEGFVRGASALAESLGVPRLVVGLTVVAFGTSAPELSVSVSAALQGNADVAVGNVVGSNIFNVLAILGLSALVAPLGIGASLLKVDAPLMVAASLAVLGVGWDGAVTKGEGTGLFLGLLAYLALQFVRGRSHPVVVAVEATAPLTPKRPPMWLNLVFLAVGLGLLVLGSDWLVKSAVLGAKALGVSDLVIGLTIVAAGTSLPEVATSMLASLRGEREIAVGNVVGSCLFNVLGVLGLSAIVSPAAIGVPEQALRLDVPVMIASAALCLPLFWAWKEVTRWEGGLLFAGYLAYTTYLVLGASRPGGEASFGSFLALVGAPVALAVLCASMISYVRSLRPVAVPPPPAPSEGP